MTRNTMLRTLFSLACFAGAASAETVPLPRDVPYLGPIALAVDASDIDHRIVRVRERLPVRAGRLTLLYPRWIPGTHAPTNEVKRLAGLRIVAAGNALAWQRDPLDVHAFRVDVPAGVTMLDIEFQNLLPTDGANVALLSRELIEFEWQGVVLAPAGFDASRIEVDASLRLPAGWQQATALRPVFGAEPARYERVSLETLLDSPVFAGKHVRRFNLDPGNARPVTLHVFATGPEPLVITDAQVDAHRKLVQQADRLFGSRHFAHYDLMLALNDDHPWVGLEHHQSSENATKAGYFTDWEKTSVVRDLLPHEYTHSWNGKFRRPRDLWAGDFNVPTQNSLLWVYEGQTEYWGQVLAARSGLVGADEMREWFAWTAAAYATLPGRSWRPLQDTTHDEIVVGRYAGLDWTSWQRTRDYYGEGALIWLDVDTRIRQQSNGARSLDDFALGFFGVEDGRIAPLLYDFGDVVAALGRVQRSDWGSFLRAKLDSTGRSPLDGLERSGWRLAWTDKQSDPREEQGGISGHDVVRLFARLPGRQGGSHRGCAVGRAGLQGGPRQRSDAARGQPARLQARRAPEGDRCGEGRYRTDRAAGQGGRRLPHRAHRLSRRAALPDAGTHRGHAGSADGDLRAALTSSRLIRARSASSSASHATRQSNLTPAKRSTPRYV